MIMQANMRATMCKQKMKVKGQLEWKQTGRRTRPSALPCPLTTAPITRNDSWYLYGILIAAGPKWVNLVCLIAFSAVA